MIRGGAREATRAVGDAAEPHPAPWSSLSADDVVDMLDHLSDGVVVVGPDWAFRYVNEPAARMLSRGRDELLGKGMWAEFPDESGNAFRAAYEEAVRERQPVRLVSQYEPLGRWFEIRAFPQNENLVIVFRDVTEIHEAEGELREYAMRMSEAEQIVHFGVWKWELASGRVRWSDQLHRIYGIEPGEFAGTVEDFIGRLHPDDRDRVGAEIARVVETGEGFVFEERILRPDGEERTLLSQGHAINGEDGSVEALVGVCHDITDRTKIAQALGASERRMRAIIDNTPSVITVKDLDGRYLMTNSESARVFGLSSEDLIGKRCQDVFPPSVAAAQRANDIQAASEGEAVFDETILVQDGEPKTFITVTFALPDEEGRPAETCTIATDVTDTRERETERRERTAWARRINSALEEGRMLVYAQPIYDLSTGAHTASELLVRMRSADDHPEILTPAVFLPTAERFGLIQEIDAWMVAQALELPATFSPEVNLSAVTLCDPDARSGIIDLLASSPEAAKRLIFEITETAAAEHFEGARAFAEDATALGCRLALDDFGTGFGSFTYLVSLPLSFLKIDLSFVRGLGERPDDRRVIESIIATAERFGLKTIAEGIEDQTKLDLLRDMGADLAQGYHLARPAPLVTPATV